MPQTFAAARLILLIIAGSYVLSALILMVVKSRGETVPIWVIATWLLTGLIGAALATALAPARPAVWIGLLLALGPWMLYSFYGDLRLGHWIIAFTDVAALVAIGYALAITSRATWMSE